jgi:hypothetical protein
MIDNARVLWWAWAGDEPFGFCGDIPVYGFAVCRYDSGELYRFSCNREWETVNDLDHDDEETAKRSIPMNYLASAHRIVWHKTGT